LRTSCAGRFHCAAISRIASTFPEATLEGLDAPLAVLDGRNLLGLRDSVESVLPGEIERWRLCFPRGE